MVVEVEETVEEAAMAVDQSRTGSPPPLDPPAWWRPRRTRMKS